MCIGPDQPTVTNTTAVYLEKKRMNLNGSTLLIQNKLNKLYFQVQGHDNKKQKIKKGRVKTKKNFPRFHLKLNKQRKKKVFFHQKMFDQFPKLYKNGFSRSGPKKEPLLHPLEPWSRSSEIVKERKIGKEVGEVEMDVEGAWR